MSEACLACGEQHSDAVQGESTFSGAIPWTCRRCRYRMWAIWDKGVYVITVPMQEWQQTAMLEYKQNNREDREDRFLHLIGFF